ncbi:hypothetical protein HWV62_7904 [Athelia sp. TMB]|nr:hypothetical protein HWV62_7904 [Athelia sp. TMB]
MVPSVMAMRRSPLPGSMRRPLTLFLSLSFASFTVASLEPTRRGPFNAHMDRMEKRRALDPHVLKDSLITEPTTSSQASSASSSSKPVVPSTTSPVFPTTTSSSSHSTSVPISTSTPSFSVTTPTFSAASSVSSSTASPSLSTSPESSITIAVPTSVLPPLPSSAVPSSSSSTVSIVVASPLQLPTLSSTFSPTPTVLTVTASSTSNRLVPVASPTAGAAGDVNADRSSSGFFSNTGAVAGTFTVVGLVALGLLTYLICYCKQRNRRRGEDFDDTFEPVTPRPRGAAAVPTMDMFAPVPVSVHPSNPFVPEAYAQDAYAGPSNAYAGPSNAYAGQNDAYAGPSNAYAGPQQQSYAQQPEQSYGYPAQPRQTYADERPAAGRALTTQEHLDALHARRRSAQQQANPFGAHAIVHEHEPYTGDADSFYGGI